MVVVPTVAKEDRAVGVEVEVGVGVEAEEEAVLAAEP